MPFTVVRLRRAIVALAVLLLAVIAGALLYGRWRLRHIAQDLPGRLGIQIEQSTQGFVLSQSNGQGRTLFTLRAARAVKFKSGGRVSLHDVKIDLYNQQDNNPDTIAGADFEFDPQTQIVQSPGEARIVLRAPPSKSATMAAKNISDQTVQITTHGLVFDQKTGVATCAGEVDFQTAQSSGQAIGAEYDSKQGKLFLKSHLVLTATLRSAPAILHASSATYDRNDGQIQLWQPSYSSPANSGITAAQADKATILLGDSGSMEQLDAHGNVQLKSANATNITSAALSLLFAGNNQPRQANFSGGVRFSGNQSMQQSSGNAQQADIAFDAHGHANRVALDGHVEVQQEIPSSLNRLHRTLSADHLILHLRPARTKVEQFQTADATGNAVFQSQNIGTKNGPERTKLGGQSLNVKFAADNQIQQIDGAGDTIVETTAANGDINSSTGDTLQILFAPGRNENEKNAAVGSRSNANYAQSIRTAVQVGHVVLKQISNGKNGNSSATAQRADYVAADDTLTLTGAPVFQNSQIEMSATEMQIMRTAEKMIADGAIQTTLRADIHPGGSKSASGGLLGISPPTHIIAQHAVLTHRTGQAIFSGRARLWQGDNSIEAPTIELSQKNQTLTAFGDSSCTQCVLSSFAGQSSSRNPSKVDVPSGCRVLSGRLVYSDAEREARFSDSVQVYIADSELLADRAEVFFTSRSSAEDQTSLEKKKKLASFDRNNSNPSSVERIVATGNVRLLQSGRRAIGNRLIYTASDGYFVLTGDGSSPPSVHDVEHGTVTGKTLTFASANQAIIVDGATTTRTRIQKK